MSKTKIYILTTTLIALFAINCGSTAVRAPKDYKMDIEKKRTLIVLNDQAAPMSDTTKAPGATAMKAALLAEFDTALIIPSVPPEIQTLPKSMTESAIKAKGKSGDPVTAKDALDEVTFQALKTALGLASKVGAFDQVVFIHVESKEESPLGFIGDFLPIPKVTKVDFYGCTYDPKTEKIVVSAKDSAKMTGSTFVAQYPLAGDDFATYLIKGKE
jgi:hypothetical protein